MTESPGLNRPDPAGLEDLRVRRRGGRLGVLPAWTRHRPYSPDSFPCGSRSRPATSGGGVRAAAPLTAPAVTVGLHLWRRNALLSVLGCTATHVVLAGTVFAR
ncbi:hypothetical protein [Streptomyces sp. NPDC056045]|uniref:hypothetical protein n=1 Tax=Streptomyces sp. NPDC056045 TaxID=3345691 RepID=UPI0035DE5A57